MLALIKNKTTVSGLNLEQRNAIASALTITNPAFAQAKQQGRPTSWIDPTIPYYEFIGKDSIQVPIGYTAELMKLFPFKSSEVNDNRFEALPMNNIAFRGSLRPYQQQVIDSMADRTIGVVSAPTGAGKSVIIVNKIVVSRVPTLILVNTLELMKQMEDNIVKFTNLSKKDIGVVGDSQWNIKPVTVGTLQTLTRLNEDKLKILNKTFGQIITDEVHIIGAETYYEAVSKLDAKYKWGFSATPERADGLTPVIFWTTGPIIHEVKLSDIKDKLEIPTIRQIKTDYYFPLFSTDEYTEMVNDLCEDEDRNTLILETVEEYKTKQIVILTQRVTHAIYMAQELCKRGHKAAYLVSRLPNPKKPGKHKIMKKSDRMDVIDSLNSGKTRIVCSTYGLFSTGIDISSLEILFIAAPTKSKIKLKQSLGRIFRKADFKKEPVVVDFIDMKVDLLKYQAYARNRIYKYLEEI